MKLCLGPGVSGIGDIKIDMFAYPGITHVLDLAVEAIPYPDNTFDLVEASHILEHIPTVIYWKETEIDPDTIDFIPQERKIWKRRFSRVELMKEIYRVLKPGGIVHIAVPVGYPNWAQDPTHADVPWTHATFGYFCNQWGGGRENKEAALSSGIDFGFEWVEDYYSENDLHLTVKLRKPKQ